MYIDFPICRWFYGWQDPDDNMDLPITKAIQSLKAQSVASEPLDRQGRYCCLKPIKNGCPLGDFYVEMMSYHDQKVNKYIIC